MKSVEEARKSENVVEREWEGYSYNQLKFQIALTRTRLELKKSMMVAQGQQMMGQKVKSSSIVSRMLGALDYLDYAILAYKAASAVTSLIHRWRK